MKLLKDLLYRVAIEAVHGSTIIEVAKIEFDSRKVEPNDIFVAIRGTISDGHEYIEKAISLGATTIICEELVQKRCNCRFSICSCHANNLNSVRWIFVKISCQKRHSCV